MTFLMTGHDGEIFLDHSASPGIPPEQARLLGLPPELVGEGKRMVAPTVGCPHCGSAVMLNPMRQRARNTCYKCSKYICDICAGVMKDPDYVHRTIEEIAALVHSGKWQMSGSMSKPILTPVEG